jgi:TPR repeat protein
MDKLLIKANYKDVLDAALEGDSDAQCYLGMIWKDPTARENRGTLPVSLEQALRWYSIAAETAYEGLRQDAIRHRNDVLESLRKLRSNNSDVASHREGLPESASNRAGGKSPAPINQDQVLAEKIFRMFRSLKIASTSISDVDVRLGYLEWLQNEDDKWENDPSIGRVMPTGVDVVSLLQTMKGLGIQAVQIADADTRSAYETWIKRG